ncbi:hypothetical protein [cf. Phormidesmis sp. LEGE 11477]|uniref:hypothetical protein n=1 Tax=cf. Phormidesmis sp. LEGE 11477 TaxID=1828680 RepID=UPI00188099B7|nr:hypothetical protein [cf. Phormidesmis sp. LEGE 11477]MBE9064131.1 hypothetical protein [cf. Phormidesmis sp. LEGE 11477]
MKHFLNSGMIGMAIAIALNLYTAVVLAKPSAIFFSTDWWAQWFPSYAIWFTFIIIGGTHWLKSRSSL